MITLITATGGRPEAFKLCESYMRKQTYKGPIQWIVVDDCTPRISCTMKQEYYRGPKEWAEGINTQRLNLDAALTKVKGDYVFIIEDDDYYAPEYLETYTHFLKSVAAVGEAKSKYFNVKVPGHKIMPNLKHASLAQTAFRKELLPLFNKAVNSGELYIDIKFWKLLSEQEIPFALLTNKNLCIGIKGLPGRGGISPGHTSRDFMYDPDFKVLKSWIGNSSTQYVEFKKGK